MKIKKTKHDDYERIVKFPVLSNYFVHVVLTRNIAHSRKGRYGTIGEAEGAAAMSSVAVNGHGPLFFQPSNTAGIIAHEAWHAVFRMFEWAGAGLDNEMVAYHLSYLVDRIASFMAQVEFMESNQSSTEEATHGNKDSQRELVGVQGVPTHSGRASTEAGKTGAPHFQTEASDFSNGRLSR